jgi:hypothetical protein
VNKSRLADGSVLVAFELPAAVSAESVSVCGEFNGWSPQTHPLTRLESGGFRAELPLPAGHRWRFRYLLDGRRWENDWAADAYVPNGLGEDDSVVDLTDPSKLPAAGQATQAASVAPSVAVTPALAAADPDGGAGARPEDGEPRPARRGRWRRLFGRRSAEATA